MQDMQLHAKRDFLAHLILTGDFFDLPKLPRIE